MNQLDDYFTLLTSALAVLQSCITGLNLYFMGKKINLQMIIGVALFTAIINAIIHPKDDEYSNLGD